MTTNIEQRKIWTLIGILALISITVNASYAHVHRRYQNGLEFVQRTQPGQSAAAIATPAKPSVEYSPPSQAMPVSYTLPEDSASLLSSLDASSDVQVIARSRQPHLTEEEKLSRKKERMEARKEAATNDSLALNTNAVVRHEDAKHAALSPKAKDQVAESHVMRRDAEQSPKTFAPQIWREQGKNSERVGGVMIKKAVDTKIATAPKETVHSATSATLGNETTDINVQTPPTKEVKTANAATRTPSVGKTAKTHNEIKTPPNAPSPAVMERIRKGLATDTQSSDQSANQDSPQDSRRNRDRNQNQNNQTRQQYQQNRNNGNNGGGNGGGGGRRR